MDREITFAAAIREALREEMQADGTVILMGEDIKYSVWGVTGGLVDEFGEDRVMHMPISENGFCSAALGAAMTGLRPVVELMYGDFLLLAADAVLNEAAKYRYMCGGGEFRVPTVVRAAGCGTGTGSGCHHSQSLEALAMHFPGVKVAIPSTPYDAKGLLKTAIRDDNPVVFFEHKLLYGTKGPVPEGEYLVPFGQAVLRRHGSRVTLISYSHACLKTLKAAEQLATEGIDAEVIDLRTLLPLDMDTVLASVRKTRRVVVVEDDTRTGGAGAEIVARIGEEGLDYLDAPPVRVAARDAPIPASRYGEKFVVPSVADIAAAVRGILEE